jgi:hypothetical protein
MTVLEGTVKTPFGEVSKKTAVIVGVGLVGLLGIVYYRSKKAKATAGAGANTGIDPATGYPYGSPEDAAALEAQAAYVTPTGVGGSGGGGGSGGTGFATNGQWAQAAEQFMQADGLVEDPAALAAALGKYITGQPVSDVDMSLIDQAIAFQGYPPVAGPSGYPPSINRAPVTPPTDTTPPPTNTPPTSHDDPSPEWQNVYKGHVVDDWINASGNDWGSLVKLNPGILLNVAQSNNPRERTFLYDTAYRVR